MAFKIAIKEIEDFPTKLNICVKDGDLDYGYYDVYVAEDIEKWIEDLRKVLKEISQDQTVVRRSNEALHILRIIDTSLEGPKVA